MRVHATTAALVVSAVLSVPVAASGEDDDPVQRELRELRQRVEELEAWKRAHEEGGDGAAIRAAVAEYLSAHPELALPQAVVRAPKARAIEIGGMVRLRGEMQRRSYLPEDPDGRDTNDVVVNRVRVWVKADVDEDLAALAEFQDARVWGGEASTIANSANTDLSQGWLEFRNLAGTNTTLRAGRQRLALSDERFIGSLEWANTGRHFDGLTAFHEAEGRKLTAFAWRISEGFLEPAGVLGPGVSGGDTDVNLFGAWTTWTDAVPESTWEAFALFLKAGRPTASEPEFLGDTPGRGNTGFATYGTRLFGADPSGLDWDLQAAVQRGDIADDPLRAWAARAGIGWRFADTAGKPRAGVEYDFATGEDRGDDGRREQFQVLFPTNHPHYGIHDYAAWSNLRAWSVNASIEPSETTKLEAAFWDLDLDEAQGGWILASGARLRPGAPGLSRELGREIDMIFTWRYSPNATFQVGWAHFFPGRFVKETQGPEGDVLDTDFAYVQAIVTF